MSTTSRILILDFGSQYTQLIARRLRELKVYCEIYPCDASLEKMKTFNPRGIILSGGPYSVYDKNAPHFSKNSKETIFNFKVPILGICYGMQLIAKQFDGKVVPAKTREYGRAYVQLSADSLLFSTLPHRFQVWMSHGDEIGKLPAGFCSTATSHNQSLAAMENISKKIYAVQFHPEVIHTENGIEIFKNFLFKICHVKPDWDLGHYLQSQISKIKNQVGNKFAICALSGGVDSTVAATLVSHALGDRLKCVFVNNGLLRKDEAAQVIERFHELLKLKVTCIDASTQFLKKLAHVTNAERKRKIIGKEFIRIFEKYARGSEFLVQGTLYPDVIESYPPPKEVKGKGSVRGLSSTIKSHHNVGGLPKKMKFKLIEPLRELFKDEVRTLGKQLQIPDSILNRHPFPGPGLAVRIMGEVTQKRLDILREVDAIFIEEIKKQDLYDQIWQAFSVYLPVQSVGVMGDGRTYENVVALRAVTSQDGMTADWYHFDSEFLRHVSNRITGEVKGVNRVVYDISSKPPATIEWE